VDRTADLDDGTLPLAMIAIQFLEPLLYGLCYRNGPPAPPHFRATTMAEFAHAKLAEWRPKSTGMLTCVNADYR
jgi:hypothetical protein